MGKDLEKMMSDTMERNLAYVEETKDYPHDLFMAGVAMLVEERCAIDEVDVIDEFEALLASAKEVRKLMGVYEREVN